MSAPAPDRAAIRPRFADRFRAEPTRRGDPPEVMTRVLRHTYIEPRISES